MHSRERMPEPAHSVLLLLGMAVLSWAAVGLAGVALWPRQSEVQPVGNPPLAVNADPSPPAAVHGHHSTVVVDAEGRRPAAKQAVRRKVKVAAKRRRGPSFAARVFSVSTN